MRNPNVGRYLAAQAIRKAFTENSLPMRLEEIEVLCASETRPRLLAAYLRWQRALIDRILVHSLMDDLPEIERDFVHYRYRMGRSMQWINMNMPVSERNLYFMNDRILLRLATLLFYEPTMADVFSRTVLLNLLRVIDARLAVFSLRVDLPADAGWLERLARARCRCHALLHLIDAYLTPNEDSPAHRIIRQKLQTPHTTLDELLDRTGIPSSEREKNMAQDVLRNYLSRAEACLGIKKIPDTEKFAVFSFCNVVQ